MNRLRDELTVHMMVRNEEHWIWFAVLSALPFCQRLMAWDTGSDDRTLDILADIDDPRLSVVSLGPTAADCLVATRNQMLKQTDTPWFAIVDGDEVWTDATWRVVDKHTSDASCDVVVVSVRCPFPRLGFFHSAVDDDFAIAGVRGPFAARVFRRTAGMQWQGAWGSDALVRADGHMLTRGEEPFMRVVHEPVWHMTLLSRSACDDRTFWRRGKIHIDDAREVALTEVDRGEIPEIFVRPRPARVADPFLHQCPEYVAALQETR